MLSSLKIGPYRVPVLNGELEKLRGLYVPDPMAIKMDSTQEPCRYWSTMLHESLHVLEDIYGLKMTEKDIRAWEVGLVSLLVENPGLVRGLVEGFPREGTGVSSGNGTSPQAQHPSPHQYLQEPPQGRGGREGCPGDPAPRCSVPLEPALDSPQGLEG